MSIVSRFRAWNSNRLYRKAWRKRRRQLLKLRQMRWGKESVAEHFGLVKKALNELLDRVEAVDGRVPLPYHGICFNAGFLYGGPETGERYRNQCGTFLALCAEYNRTVRGVIDRSHAYPFSDVDAQCNFERWEGEARKVRLDAIRWILIQIEYYELDRP